MMILLDEIRELCGKKTVIRPAVKLRRSVSLEEQR